MTNFELIRTVYAAADASLQRGARRWRVSSLLAVVPALLTVGQTQANVYVSTGDTHSDVMPYDSNGTAAGGQILAGVYDFDLDQVVEDVQLFVRRMTFAQTTFHGTTDPGFTTFVGYTLPASSNLSFNAPALQHPLVNIESNLLYWDGNDHDNDGRYDDLVTFAPPTNGDQLFIRKSSSVNTTLTGSSADVPGYIIDATSSAGTLHKHLSYQLRNVSGPTQVPAADGYYLLSLTLSVPGLTASDPLYFLFSNDYQRDAQGNIVFTGNRPLTNTLAEAAAIKWASKLLLSTPGDLNDDGLVTDADLLILRTHYTGRQTPGQGNATYEQGDIDFDGDVDFADAMHLRRNFTGGDAAFDAAWASIVPEPTSALLALGCSALLLSRRGTRLRNCQP